MSEQTKHNLKWWLKTTLQVGATTAIAFAPEILRVFPEHTLAFKLALPVGIFLKTMFVKSEYMKDQLPSGITKFMDKVPDKYTGEKGSKK